MVVPDASPLQNARDFDAFSALIYCQLGAILWDFATTVSFDWGIVRGRNPWAWPMVAYFVARYGSFVALVPLIIQINVPASVDCSRLWIAIVIGIKMQKLGAEVLFGLRAIAVFDYNRLVVAFVSLLLLATAGVGLASIAAASWAHHPGALPGLPGSCVPIRWSWELGVAYVLTLVYAVVVIGLVVFRLQHMGKRVRSSLLTLVYRDGIIFLILAIIPTLLAVALFYAGKTAPAQSATMTLSATLHALLATRAYRNLSDLCERLPMSMRYEVSNGTKLDEETLGRIAFVMGAPRVMHMEHGDIFDGSSSPIGQKRKEAGSPSPSMRSLQADASSCSDKVQIVTQQHTLDDRSM